MLESEALRRLAAIVLVAAAAPSSSRRGCRTATRLCRFRRRCARGANSASSSPARPFIPQAMSADRHAPRDRARRARTGDRGKSRLAPDEQVIGLHVAIGAVLAISRNVAGDQARMALYVTRQSRSPRARPRPCRGTRTKISAFAMIRRQINAASTGRLDVERQLYPLPCRAGRNRRFRR